MFSPTNQGDMSVRQNDAPELINQNNENVNNDTSNPDVPTTDNELDGQVETQPMSYAEAAAHINDAEVLSTLKPVFIEEYDIFGSTTVNRRQYMKHPEMYRCISRVASAKTIKGLQRVRGMWRIYLDREYDRDQIIVRGVNIRKKHVPVYSQNPRVQARETPDGLRIRVKDIPLSADDGQIIRKLEFVGCTVTSTYRERLRIDGLLTDCQTGDRIITVTPIGTPLPRYMEIGKYNATIIHRGQIPPGGLKCNKCLGDDHRTMECPNDWRCRFCNELGHKQEDCEAKTQMENDNTDSENEEDGSSHEDSETQNEKPEENAQEKQAADRVILTGQRKNKDKDNSKKGEKRQETLTSYINFTLTPNNPDGRAKNIDRSPVTPPDVLRAQEKPGTEKKVRK